MFQNRFDEFYLTICKQTGGIQGLLKSFFDFMIRKTDFFYECDPGDKMGFPPGYSRKLLLSIFQKFQQQHYKRFPKKDPAQYERKLKKYREQQQQKNKPKQQIKQQVKKQQTQNNQKKTQKIQTASTEKSKQVNSQLNKKETVQLKKTNVQPIINTYNGGANEKYSWSQQSHDVQVTLQIDNGLAAKMINVNIATTSISIKKKTGEVLLQGQLYQKINAGQSMWKIEKSGNKTFLTLNLEKAQDKIWSTVFKGDPQIDTTKVNNTKPLHQFDGQTQGAIRKIMYQQQRKHMGLPTTEEQKQLQALKKAWDADGSPFKGQPFDPSKFNLTGSQMN